MSKTGKVLSILCSLPLVGLWFGFSKLLAFIPTSWTPASIVYIIIMLGVLAGTGFISFIILLMMYFLWKDKGKKQSGLK